MVIRLCDTILAAAMLILLSPLLICVMVLLKLTGEGEIFFIQNRVGKDRREFKLYKFATMLKDSPSIGTGTVTMKNDPRILPVGAFLRKTKINELPQLLNVLLGDMSLIGPRPQAQRCFDAFPARAQNIIVQVKPGLSGIGPIVFRGEEDLLQGDNSSLAFYDNSIGPYKGDVEAWYIERQSVFTYVTLLLITVWVVIFPKSNLVWRVFKDLPAPPDDLKSVFNYRS